MTRNTTSPSEFLPASRHILTISYYYCAWCVVSVVGVCGCLRHILATQWRIARCTRVRAPALQAPWECLPKLSSGIPHNCPLCASQRDSRQAESVEKGLLKVMVLQPSATFVT